MNGQDAKIRRQISYDQCVFTGWIHRRLIKEDFLHSKRRALRSSVTNSQISYNVGKGSKLKSFWPKIFNMRQLAACLIYDLINCLHIFISIVLTQLRILLFLEFHTWHRGTHRFYKAVSRISSRKYSSFMQPEVSLLCAQKPATGPILS